MATPQEGQGYGKLAVGLVLCVAGAAALHWQGAIAGLIVGIAIGHWIDLRLSRPLFQAEGPVPAAAYEVDHEAQKLFAGEIALVFTALVRALERDPTQAEGALWRFLRDGLDFGELGVAAAEEAIRSAAGRDVEIAAAADRCARALPRDQQRLLVAALYELARELGAAAGPTRLAMRDAVAVLGVSEDDEARVRAATFGGAEAQDYRTLGVGEAASDADVRRAFRLLAGKLHPDKVASLGPKAVELATREFEEVRGAYERIRAVRGF